MGRDLSAINGATSEFVDVQKNTTGLFSPIVTIKPDRGQYVRIRNRVPVGDSAGVPVYMKLQNSSGNDLPPNTEVVFAYKPTGSDQWKHVSTKLSNIQSYNVTAFGEQQAEDRIDSFKIPLDGQALEVRDVDEAAILIKSSEQFSPANSMVNVEGQAVEVGDLTR